MRVGMICPYSLGVWGGVQNQVLGLGRSLRQKGVAVQVLAPCDGLPPEPWVTPLGNSVPYAQNGSMAPIAPDLPAQLRVLGAIWDEDFDLLHLHEPLAPGPTLTALTVKPTPLIGTFHASGKVASYRWLKPLLSKLTDRLDIKVAVSAEAATMAKSHLGGNYEVLCNGIEVEKFANATPTERPSSDQNPTVFFLARHERRKGLDVLLKASSQLPADVVVWIGGEGPETEMLQAEHRDNERLVWLGTLSEEEKSARLKAADVFCVPSIGGESFGVVLLEGMAAGTPVVASDLEAYRVTTAGCHAELFDVGDSDQLARSLMKVLSGGQEIAAMVASATERAAEFSMESLADTYLTRYQQMLAP